MKLKKDEYFSDDCIIEDPFYISVKDLITCTLCNKIFKEPYMCNGCQKIYCKSCLKKDYKLKICPAEKKEAKFSPGINSNALISKLKYKCKNCLKEVAQSDIKTHLNENCKRSKKIEREKTLAEMIKVKKELIKLSRKDVENNVVSNKISGKKILY